MAKVPRPTGLFSLPGRAGQAKARGPPHPRGAGPWRADNAEAGRSPLGGWRPVVAPLNAPSSRLQPVARQEPAEELSQPLPAALPVRLGPGWRGR